jgi:hypothetical protein
VLGSYPRQASAYAPPCSWQSYPGNPNQVFDFSQLPTIRPVGHTNLCLDAGSNPTDASRVHLWQCYDGLPQQA